MITWYLLNFFIWIYLNAMVYTDGKLEARQLIIVDKESYQWYKKWIWPYAADDIHEATPKTMPTVDTFGKE